MNVNDDFKGPFGYSHYTGKATDPHTHEPAFIPQSIVDSWEVLCSCGKWHASESFYAIASRDDLIAALRAEHAKHVAAKAVEA